MDEENIVRRMIDGDMEAFGTLMEQYEKPEMLRTVRTLSRRHLPPAI